jgi:hypothetical protein
MGAFLEDIVMIETRKKVCDNAFNVCGLSKSAVKMKVRDKMGDVVSRDGWKKG